MVKSNKVAMTVLLAVGLVLMGLILCSMITMKQPWIGFAAITLIYAAAFVYFLVYVWKIMPTEYPVDNKDRERLANWLVDNGYVLSNRKRKLFVPYMFECEPDQFGRFVQRSGTMGECRLEIDEPDGLYIYSKIKLNEAVSIPGNAKFMSFPVGQEYLLVFEDGNPRRVTLYERPYLIDDDE